MRHVVIAMGLEAKIDLTYSVSIAADGRYPTTTQFGSIGSSSRNLTAGKNQEALCQHRSSSCRRTPTTCSTAAYGMAATVAIACAALLGTEECDHSLFICLLQIPRSRAKVSALY